MKSTKPIKSKKFIDRFSIDKIFGITCGYYNLYTKEELIEFIEEKHNNSYSIVKINEKYLLILKINSIETFISIITGNKNCIDDIINL